MDIKRGDVFMADMRGVGSMQVGMRPVVIVSNNKCNTFSRTVTVVPFTSSETKSELPTHIEVDRESKTHKLHGIGLAECITTIDKTLLDRKVGELSAKEMLRVNIAILIQVGIDVFDMVKECTIEMFNCIKGGYVKHEASVSNIGTIGSYVIEKRERENTKGKRR